MTKKGILTTEEYTAYRKLLGFTQEQAKEFHGVQNVRTIKRWEKGDSFVSEIACQKILNLAMQIQFVIDNAIESWQKHKAPVTLIIYPDECYKKFVVGIGDLPNSVHRAMIERVYIQLKNLGADVGIVMFEPQLYMMWLAQNGYKDSQDIRGAWAAEYYEQIKIV